MIHDILERNINYLSKVNEKCSGQWIWSTLKIDELQEKKVFGNATYMDKRKLLPQKWRPPWKPNNSHSIKSEEAKIGPHGRKSCFLLALQAKNKNQNRKQMYILAIRRRATYHICRNNFQLVKKVFPAALILSSSLE